MQNLLESLYGSTLEGRWEEVVSEYQSNAWIQKRPINITNDTALHAAVNDDRADVVEKLVLELKKSRESLAALEVRNEKGDTPLHCAASRGSLVMCKLIVEAQGGDYNLIQAHNNYLETPLYLAALHGHRDAFLYLYYRCLDKTVWPCRRGSDGDTVLHCTIRRDYFELAFDIIRLYGEQIVGSVDENGITPLHILANKPSAFISSSNFRWYNKLFYCCIMVEPFMIREQRSKNKGTFLTNWLNSPENQTGCWTKVEEDTENPYGDACENVPPNYRTCNILVRALLTCFIWLLHGAFGLEDIRKKKEKHVWCGKILEALWKHKNIAYVGGGSASHGGRPLAFGLGHDSDQKGQKEEEEDEEIFFNPFNIDRYETGDRYTNQEGMPNVGGSQKKQEEKMKEQHTQIVPVDQSKQKELVEFLRSLCNGNVKDAASKPFAGCCLCLSGEEEENSCGNERETAFFVAAKNGVLEIVKKILKDKPGAIHEINAQGQNVLLAAVGSRQPHVIELLKKERLWKNLLFSVDNVGNTILHVVAKSKFQIQGSIALEMQHEIKWYEYVKSVVPSYVTLLTNIEGKTPEDIFLSDHKVLFEKSDEWLCRTSESCSVVAALVAGVAFATSSTVPGGNDDNTGRPTLEGKPGFDIFAISGLTALCFSVTALILFLSILTSRKHPADFMKKLPLKLFLALSSLFVSIFSMFISFCAAHSFVFENKSKKSVLLLYAIICLPVSFTIVEFPLYMDLSRAIFIKVPPPNDHKRI